ncbi:TRAP-type C4-dicarboxylate transport system substrate-binding protein [Pacificibacter maritimus]|uniref:TRAP-type C4-dicarboxylate transport system substrate-binding protein n=1 Tax=Pacificibacter maritimus TaxID=762213 RepID=A0A3N4UND5_9RHOB|nr:TRAP transporter substrate-binding protein [Pacificibacter maritimus]RPE72132.1 TRAP-type C4-dicarboxylate transport system substrate-binding protein [Pacificibacter maritimus]
MRKNLTALCLAAATALTPLATSAERLVFGTGNVVIHPLNERIMTPWAERVNAEANGAVDINVRHGQMLVNGGNYVDRVQDDVVQIAFGMLVFNPGRFPRSLVSTVPFIEGSAEASSLAYCNLYEAGAFDDELDDFQPLMFVPFPQSSAHTNGGPLTTMSDLDGKKIMVGSPIASEIVSAYGGAPLSIILPEQYQALQRSTADGNFMTFTAFPAFNLDEVTSDHLLVPLGGATGMVFMDRERFDALSDEAKTALGADSVCERSREAGAEVDLWEAESMAYVKAQGHTVNEIDPEEFAAMRDNLGERIFKTFADRAPDGENLLAEWIDAIDAARREIGEIE